MWARFDGTDSVVQSAVRTAGTWSTPVVLSASGHSARLPQVTVDPQGNATAVWVRHDGTNDRVQGAWRAGTGTWSTPADVSAGGLNATNLQVATDPRGNASAAWAGDDGSHPIVQGTVLDAAGPVLGSVQIPSTGTAGQSLAFSATASDTWSALGATTWSFGDGGTATGLSVTHTYAAGGTYTVTVTGSDALGNTSTATGTLTIAAAPVTPPPPVSPPPSSPPPSDPPPPDPFAVNGKTADPKTGNVILKVQAPGTGTLKLLGTHGTPKRKYRTGLTPGRGLIAWGRLTLKVTKAGEVKATLKPNARGRKILRYHRLKGQRLRIRVVAAFTPTGGTTTKQAFDITLLPAKPGRRG